MPTAEFMIEINKYFALATFLMPSIIAITIRSMVTPINCRSFSEDIFNFLSYGIINFVIFQLFFLILNIQFKSLSLINIFTVENLSSWLNWILYLLYVFILPIILGIVMSKLDQKDWIKNILQKCFKFSVDNGILTTWAELPRYECNSKVKITLKNGKIIEGKLAESSKISRSFEHKDIYITELEKINEEYIESKHQAWINGDEIVSIIFTNQHIELRVLYEFFTKNSNTFIPIYGSDSRIYLIKIGG